MPGWSPLENLLEYEFTQSREEGRDPAVLAELKREFEEARTDPARLSALHETLLSLPIRADFPFIEPDGLDEIRRERVGASNLAAALPPDLEDRMLGAWLGRCVGCILGKPVESFMGEHNGHASWQRQKRYLTAVDPGEWPLRDYFPADSPAKEEVGVIWCIPSTREHLAFVETDDDIRYTVLGQIVLQNHGLEFATSDVATAWIRHLPYGSVCTAETQAYRNLVLGGRFHPRATCWEEPDWNWVATHLNPYREWIGAQIRVDSYGYAAPGRPELAAEMAWRDARLSHTKNGIYGAMFCAAMISAAFVAADAREIIEIGLGEIPAGSRLHAAIRETVTDCEAAADYEDALVRIYTRLGHYHPVHTINNAAICAASLWFSKGDFSKGVTLAVMGGWDTDCNGATVGSIVGAMTGGSRVPEFWTGRLHDTLKADIPEYHPIAISECASRAVEIARKAVA
jgi:ADP-ribosylglycohydrolase